jgi:EmrB/QacA subfamily drug resistance transporter
MTKPSLPPLKPKSNISDTIPVTGRWIAMSALLVANFMNIMDVTIVNVAIPSIQKNLGANDSQIEWIIAIYMLTFALLLLPSGRLGDVFGKRQMFMAGVTIFTMGSAACGMASSVDFLIPARILQALGGAMMTPQILAMVPILFLPEERGAVFALFGLTAGMAAVAGPPLAGFLIHANLFDLGWRPIFLVNVPVGMIAILAVQLFGPKTMSHRGDQIDIIGIILAMITLLCILFPLIEGRQLGWPMWCYATLALALPMAWTFLRWEKRRATQDLAQLLPERLLKNENYILGTGLAALLFSGIPGFFFIWAVTLQSGNGLSALESGITTMPFPIGVLFASIISGRLGSSRLRLRISFGALLLAAGLAGVYITVPSQGEDLVRSAFVLPLIVAGLGLGLAISPLFQIVLYNVSSKDTGSASGALQAFQQVGGALGLAIVGEAFFSTVHKGIALGGDAKTVFADALSNGLLFCISVFLLLAILVWRLPKPIMQI